MTGGKTTRKNPNALSDLRRRSKRLESYVVRVGWAVSMGADPEAVKVAAINTFGAPSKNIPARPVLPAFIQASRDEIHRAFVDGILAELDGDSPEPALQGLATTLANGLRQAVQDYNAIPNAPSTVESKGFNDPLVGAGSDGGRIVANANAMVVRK